MFSALIWDEVADRMTPNAAIRQLARLLLPEILAAVRPNFWHGGTLLPYLRADGEPWHLRPVAA